MKKITPKNEMREIERLSKLAHKNTLKNTQSVEKQIEEQRLLIEEASRDREKERDAIHSKGRARGRI